MISKEEVKHIAKLARLGLTPDEIKKFQKDISSVLDYIEKLKEAETSGIEQLSNYVIPLKNVKRRDEPAPAPKEAIVKLIEAAPAQKDNYIRTKAILRNRPQQAF